MSIQTFLNASDLKSLMITTVGGLVVLVVAWLVSRMFRRTPSLKWYSRQRSIKLTQRGAEKTGKAYLSETIIENTSKVAIKQIDVTWKDKVPDGSISLYRSFWFSPIYIVTDTGELEVQFEEVNGATQATFRNLKPRRLLCATIFSTECSDLIPKKVQLNGERVEATGEPPTYWREPKWISPAIGILLAIIGICLLEHFF